MTTILLHASALSFTHPVTLQVVTINAGLQEEFKQALQLMNFKS